MEKATFTFKAFHTDYVPLEGDMLEVDNGRAAKVVDVTRRKFLYETETPRGEFLRMVQSTVNVEYVSGMDGAENFDIDFALKF